MKQQTISWSLERAAEGIHLAEVMVKPVPRHKWAYVVVCSTCGVIEDDLPYTDPMAAQASRQAQAHTRSSMRAVEGAA